MARMHVILNTDATGDIKCFCPYEEYLQGLCVCREKFDCPEAIIEFKILVGTKPSEQTDATFNKINRDLKKTARVVEQKAGKIKQGLASLEKAIKRSKFKI